MYESGERSGRRKLVRCDPWGRHDNTKLTSGSGDTATQRDKWSDMLAEQMSHLFDEFDADAGVAANQGIHTDQDRPPDP